MLLAACRRRPAVERIDAVPVERPASPTGSKIAVWRIVEPPCVGRRPRTPARRARAASSRRAGAAARSGSKRLDAPEVERVADRRAIRDRAGRGACRRRRRAGRASPRSRHSQSPAYQPVRPPMRADRREGALAAGAGTWTRARVDEPRAEPDAAARTATRRRAESASDQRVSAILAILVRQRARDRLAQPPRGRTAKRPQRPSRPRRRVGLRRLSISLRPTRA